MRALLRQMVSVGHVVARRAWLPGGKGNRGRRKMAVARLGGDGRPRRTFPGRLRLRWRLTALYYRRAMRRLRAACASGAVQRVLEGAATVGAARLDAGV
ncbi:hypothetical protein PVAP13_9KG217000 [Panicum virgatum]|uniref:Uncharacterized protein n=1 Tax=Panicum virgatum TaxID=38727 RepID=A0A8T0NHF4_PANVG|nr:hypothetical protein PVAP13_9KG217000 [Panicum virgatum]